jgi:broad specificity phosphatase PhoE
MTDGPEVWLVRHGQTEWSANGRHTGRTDIELTSDGEAQAQALIAAMERIAFDLVLCSPRRRAQRTAVLAGLSGVETDEDLQEWDYGDLEGLTTPQIQERFPSWSIWDGPWPGGESAADVAARADRLIGRVRQRGAQKVALVGHGHFSRVIGARWVGAEVTVGRWLEFDTASWSHLGWDRGTAVLAQWNVPPHP